MPLDDFIDATQEREEYRKQREAAEAEVEAKAAELRAGKDVRNLLMRGEPILCKRTSLLSWQWQELSRWGTWRHDAVLTCSCRSKKRRWVPISGETTTTRLPGRGMPPSHSLSPFSYIFGVYVPVCTNDVADKASCRYLPRVKRAYDTIEEALASGKLDKQSLDLEKIDAAL